MDLKYHYIRCDLESAQALLDVNNETDIKICRSLGYIIDVVCHLENLKTEKKPIIVNTQMMED